MFSKLRVVIRDTKSPCKPYSSTAHSFFVLVFNCDMTLLKWFPCTGVGPGGGKIYGEAEIPQGCYLVVAVAPCKNVVTNWVLACVCCDGVTCVNLIPRTFQQCINEISTAINTALAQAGYSFGSPEEALTEDLKKALTEAKRVLTGLRKFLPEHPVPAAVLPVLKETKAPEELIKMFTP